MLKSPGVWVKTGEALVLEPQVHVGPQPHQVKGASKEDPELPPSGITTGAQKPETDGTCSETLRSPGLSGDQKGLEGNGHRAG